MGSPWSAGQLNFGMENGQIFQLNDSEKEQIRKLEDNGDQLVYAVVRNDSDYGRTVNFIIVNIGLKPT